MLGLESLDLSNLLLVSERPVLSVFTLDASLLSFNRLLAVPLSLETVTGLFTGDAASVLR